MKLKFEMNIGSQNRKFSLKKTETIKALLFSIL